jgi:phage/plasmid-associated DNA primase
MYYAKKRESPTSKVLSPIPEAFSAAAREYAEENDKLQMFIDESCITGVSFAITKADFVKHFTTFLYAGGYDTSLAGEGLGRAMGIKGFPQTPLDGKKNKMIKMLHSKARKGGFFGLRLKTDKEMQQE